MSEETTNQEPDFSDPNAVLDWWAGETVKNYRLMKRESALARQRILNDILDKWQRARKSIVDAELLAELQRRLDELETSSGIRRIK